MPEGAGPQLQVFQQQHGDECCPDLDVQRVGAGAHKGFDAQILLQIAEEDFDLPAFSIDLRDGGGTKGQVVAQQHQDFLTFLNPYFDPAESRRLPVVLAAQRYDFILENVAIFRDGTFFKNTVVRIVAQAGHKENPAIG